MESLSLHITKQKLISPKFPNFKFLFSTFKKPLNMIALTDLDVYKLAEKISDMVWNDYDRWPEKAQRTIGFQIIRSADSISINIAEGYGRYTPADRKNFYRYSRGSFEETKGWLRKASRRNLIEIERTQEYLHLIDELGPKLNAFINSTIKHYGN
jgi:four helix bundle protein